ncbi:type IX secretion system protein PorG [Chryseobacterium sp. MP_3.2]|uniref:type IX secretion system protein PorG n=1 Tax=Chryseobacterium sp. MP_3.2 TaxID=3071712 RepID=UPI002DF93E8E|nr:hypothetical protein [Chryseobacterium sp. MP_3.2]
MKTYSQPYMQKKYILAFLSLIFISVFYKGQRHEVGVQLGMSNLVGDIGRTNYILQKPINNISDYGIPFYGGILYRMNFNPYQTVRFNFGVSTIQFIDALAKETYRRNRQLSGTNTILEADLIFEYNFFPVNDEQKSLLSPYIFGGIGGLYANVTQVSIENDFRRDAGGVAQTPVNEDDFVTTQTYNAGKKITMAIPFGVGLKYKFNYNWALFGEFMFRPTFSDSIDYSMIDEKDAKLTYNKDILSGTSTKSLLQEESYVKVAEQRAADFLQNRQIGNINSKDWVNSVTLGLSYSFGRPPCYCEN